MRYYIDNCVLYHIIYLKIVKDKIALSNVIRVSNFQSKFDIILIRTGIFLYRKIQTQAYKACYDSTTEQSKS
jgi:hypothetical protein